MREEPLPSEREELSLGHQLLGGVSPVKSLQRAGEGLGKGILGGGNSRELSRPRGQGIPTQGRRVRPGWREAQARVLNPERPGQGHRGYALGTAEPKWALNGE